MVLVLVSGQALQTTDSQWSVLSDSMTRSSIGSVDRIGDTEIGGDREFVRNVPEVDDNMRPSSVGGEHCGRIPMSDTHEDNQ